MKFRKSVRFAGAAVAAAGLTAIGLVALAQAQTPPPLKIGVMDGFSGVYGDLTAGEVEAMQMAIEDATQQTGGKVLGRTVEILSADHQTKPDVGASIARRWYDVDGVKMITGLGTSSVALAVRKVSQEKGLIDINTGAASADARVDCADDTSACSWTGSIVASTSPVVTVSPALTLTAVTVPADEKLRLALCAAATVPVADTVRFMSPVVAVTT